MKKRFLLITALSLLPLTPVMGGDLSSSLETLADAFQNLIPRLGAGEAARPDKPAEPDQPSGPEVPPVEPDGSEPIAPVVEEPVRPDAPAMPIAENPNWSLLHIENLVKTLKPEEKNAATIVKLFTNNNVKINAKNRPLLQSLLKLREDELPLLEPFMNAPDLRIWNIAQINQLIREYVEAKKIPVTQLDKPITRLANVRNLIEIFKENDVRFLAESKQGVIGILQSIVGLTGDKGTLLPLTPNQQEQLERDIKQIDQFVVEDASGWTALPSLPGGGILPGAEDAESALTARIRSITTEKGIIELESAIPTLAMAKVKLPKNIETAQKILQKAGLVISDGETPTTLAAKLKPLFAVTIFDNIKELADSGKTYASLEDAISAVEAKGIKMPQFASARANAEKLIQEKLVAKVK